MQLSVAVTMFLHYFHSGFDYVQPNKRTVTENWPRSHLPFYISDSGQLCFTGPQLQVAKSVFIHGKRHACRLSSDTYSSTVDCGLVSSQAAIERGGDWSNLL